MKIYRFVVILLIGLPLILASCGKTSAPPPPSDDNATPLQTQNQTELPAGYIEILINGRNFNPDSITVGNGSTVNWVSRDGEVHTVTSNMPNLFNGTIDPFGSFAYTFNQTGDYEYFCAIHGQMGMSGVVHVR